LPLLEPKDVLFSNSFYLDLSKFWDERAKLFNRDQVKAFEELDKNSGRFLSGFQVSKLFAQVGTHHRIVAAYQPKSGYKVTPGQNIPAFAVVSECREPEPFAKAMDTVLRGVALFAGSQFKLKLVEEKQGDVTLVGYRFPEDGKVPNDPGNLRFNFSPCFAVVGKSFMACSTLELGHEMVDILKKEASQRAKNNSPANMRLQLYSAGGAAFLQSIEDQLLVQAILDRGVSPDEAKAQVRKGMDLLRQLGTLALDTTYGEKDYRLNLRVKFAK